MASETTSIPNRTLLGALLCCFGYHRWKETGSKSTVIPTGNALLIRTRERVFLCTRRDCDARRAEKYERSTFTPRAKSNG